MSAQAPHHQTNSPLAKFELRLQTFIIRSLLFPHLLNVLFQESAIREQIVNIFFNCSIRQRQLLACFMKVFVLGTNLLVLLSQILNDLKDTVSVFLSLLFIGTISRRIDSFNSSSTL
jgi:hypothetical protein